MKNEQPFERLSIAELGHNLSESGQLLAYIDTCGLFYCQQGCAVVNVNGNDLNIEAGDVYVYVPSTYVFVRRTSADLRGITYRASLDFVLPLVERSSNLASIITLRESPLIHMTQEQMEQVEQMFALMDKRQHDLEALPKGAPGANLLQLSLKNLGEAMVMEVFYYHLCSSNANTAPPTKQDIVYQRFIVLLMKHHKQERFVNYYADQLCLTPRYFSTIVRQRSGHTAQEWITTIVIGSIKQALLYSNLSIKEIADDYHFPSQTFFGKYFKQYVGMSPKEFRNVMRHPV